MATVAAGSRQNKSGKPPIIDSGKRFAELRASNRHLLRGDSQRIVMGSETKPAATPDKVRAKRDAKPAINPVLSRRFPALRADTGDTGHKLVLAEPSEFDDTGAGGGSPPSGTRGSAGSRGLGSPGSTGSRRRTGTAGSSRSRGLWDPELTKSSMDEINSLRDFRRSIKRHKPAFGGTSSAALIQGVVRPPSSKAAAARAENRAKMATRAPFVPASTSAAKKIIAGDTSAYVNANTPYDAARRAAIEAEHERRKKFLAGEFRVKSATEAKKGVQVRYFMNSPDEDALAAEEMLVKERTATNKARIDRRFLKQRQQRRMDR